MASEIRVNSITNRSGLTTTTWNNQGIDIVGIVTASSFSGNLTGNVTGTASQLETNATGANLTLSGNLGVGGTITYEDVARVDATGISTFREGLKIGPLAGIALTAYTDGSIRTSGIVTASSFSGDGSSLTGISQPGGATGLDVNDNVLIRLGTGNDLYLKHTGSYSLIHDNSADLYIQGDEIHLRSNTNNDQYLKATVDSAVELYHNNVKRLETSSTGATVTGVVDADAFTAAANTGYKMVECTGGNLNISYNAWTSMADYKWDLPSAGTYLLSSSMRVRLWGTTGYIKCQLYDTTNSAGVAESLRMMFEQANGTTPKGQYNTQVTLQWVHTCSSAVQIHQQFSTNNNSTDSSIQNDSNGRNYMFWQRIG